MEFNKIQQTLKEFILSLSDDQVRQFVAYGGYFGIACGTDLENIDATDFEFIAGWNNGGVAREIFKPGLFFSGEAQDVEAADLNPSPDGGEKEIPLHQRFTTQFVSDAREYLLWEVIDGGWTDAFAAKIEYALSEQE